MINIISVHITGLVKHCNTIAIPSTAKSVKRCKPFHFGKTVATQLLCEPTP